jgi:hypothetical protein
MERVNELESIQNEPLELFTEKNNDYCNSFETYGLITTLVRMQDKISCCLSVTDKCIMSVDETLMGKLLDLYNYSTIGIMFLDYNKEDDENKKDK